MKRVSEVQGYTVIMEVAVNPLSIVKPNTEGHSIKVTIIDLRGNVDVLFEDERCNDAGLKSTIEDLESKAAIYIHNQTVPGDYPAIETLKSMGFEEETNQGSGIDVVFLS